MDAVTLALAKAYSDSQRLASTEYVYGQIRWDGNITDQIRLNAVDIGYEGCDLFEFIRISNKVIKPNGISEICLVGGDNELKRVFTLSRIESSDGIYFVYGKSGAAERPIPVVIVFDTEDAPEVNGTYVQVQFETYKHEEIVDYIGRIEGNMTETIHPIDPKFLPGAVLPVVEISNIENLTEEEQATLTAYADQRTPILVKLFDGGVLRASGVFLFLDHGNGQKIYALAGLCLIMYVDSSWSVTME